MPGFPGEPVEKAATAVGGLSPPAWSSAHSPPPLRKWFLAFCVPPQSGHGSRLVGQGKLGRVVSQGCYDKGSQVWWLYLPAHSFSESPGARRLTWTSWGLIQAWAGLVPAEAPGSTSSCLLQPLEAPQPWLTAPPWVLTAISSAPPVWLCLWPSPSLSQGPCDDTGALGMQVAPILGAST